MYYVDKDAIKQVLQNMTLDGAALRDWIRAFRSDIFRLSDENKALHLKNDQLSKQVETLEKRVRLLFARTENGETLKG